MPCLIWFVFQPVIYRYQKLLPYSLSFFNLSTVAHIWPSRLFKLLGFLFHQFFGPPKNVFGPPTMVAAVFHLRTGWSVLLVLVWCWCWWWWWCCFVTKFERVIRAPCFSALLLHLIALRWMAQRQPAIFTIVGNTKQDILRNPRKS